MSNLSERKYITIKIPKPRFGEIVMLFQGLFLLIVGSSVGMAFILAFCMMFEVVFKVKLL